MSIVHGRWGCSVNRSAEPGPACLDRVTGQGQRGIPGERFAEQHQEGQTRRETGTATREEQTSEGRKPKGATGVKQSRRVAGGRKRQEAEKA
jgi:hypothetical protein